MIKVSNLNASNKKKLSADLIIICAIAFIGSFGISFWVDRFLKIQSMQFPYKIFLGIFLTFFSAIYILKNKKMNLGKRVFIGLVSGQISGHLSVFSANFFIPFAQIKFFNTIKNFGIINMLSVEAIGAFVLGGWFLGLILFMLIPFLDRKFLIPRSGSCGQRNHPYD